LAPRDAFAATLLAYTFVIVRPATEYAAADETDQLWSVWLHRKGNVHDIAFTSGRGPRFHHVGVWVSSVTDTIHMCDVLSTTGWLASMERGPGRHGLSNAFFLYLRDPDGNGVELYWDRPMEVWPRTADGGLAMITEPLNLDALLAPTKE